MIYNDPISSKNIKIGGGGRGYISSIQGILLGGGLPPPYKISVCTSLRIGSRYPSASNVSHRHISIFAIFCIGHAFVGPQIFPPSKMQDTAWHCGLHQLGGVQLNTISLKLVIRILVNWYLVNICITFTS